MASPPALEHTDRVVIIGGAIVGSFVGWSLRQAGFTGPITVVEKDPTYHRSSTALSAAAIRTQFATVTNVEMSLHAVDLLRRITEHFGPDADVGYTERGYLILAPPDQVEERRARVAVQVAAGADVVALDPDQVAGRFPYLDLGGVGVGTFGRSGEGWFDAWSLLSLVRRAALAADVTYLAGEVVSLHPDGQLIAAVGLADGQRIACDRCVIAAGPASGRVAGLAGIELPVSPRKRTVFCFESRLHAPDFPFLADTSGIWVKPEGHQFIGGVPPAVDDDHDADGDFEPHHDLMEDVFWPALVERVPTMDRLRLTRAWAGHYEVNALDHNGVIGFHDRIENLVFATGFSGHGVMHAPATGRGVAELLTTGAYQTIDLNPLGWERVRDDRPLVEAVVI
jgi:glycine/D-amino acid oxidase-like deaminating enzyme